jgi:hypothetical protein
MKVLYDYKQFSTPKKGLFRIDINKYDIKRGGWLQKEVEHTIIGETDDSFITHLKPSEEGEWVGNKVVKHKFILPLGIHKSRLVQWTTGQLALFNIDPI